MDAARGDQIQLDIRSLNSVKLILGLGQSFTKDGLANQVYLFTELVNRNNGGYIKFPYGYKGYMIIEYDDKYSAGAGQWDF